MVGAPKVRYWQNWDVGDTTARIDAFWLLCEDGWREQLVTDMGTALDALRFPLELFEAGCGSGLIFKKLQARGIVATNSYVGGDISCNMLALARKRFPLTRFVNFDILDNDCPDAHFANVANIHVIQHLPHYDDAVAELVRIARQQLYIVAWFNPGDEDYVRFDETTRATLGQPFFNNIYSLPRFIAYLHSRWQARIEDVRIHHFGGPIYSLRLRLIPATIEVRS